MDYEQIARFEGQRALDWINEKWTHSRACPICGRSNWQIGAVQELRGFNGGNLVVGGPRAGVMPVFPVMCENCGYLHWFSALHTKVTRPDEYNDDSSEAQDG